MRSLSKPKSEECEPRPSYIQRLPKKKFVKERKKMRQLLRSMLPMEDEQREFEEEQKLFHRAGRAH